MGKRPVGAVTNGVEKRRGVAGGKGRCRRAGPDC
jgi:hypothetical protein